MPGPRLAMIPVAIPGIRHFRISHELRKSRSEVFAEARRDIVPAMVAAGYNLITLVEAELLSV